MTNIEFSVLGPTQINFSVTQSGAALEFITPAPLAIEFLIPVGIAGVKSYLNALLSYPDDAAARLAGLVTNDHYWFSLDTDAGIYDTLKRVSIL